MSTPLGGRAVPVVRRRLGIGVVLRRRLVLIGIELGPAGVVVGLGLRRDGVVVGGGGLVLLLLLPEAEPVAAAARVVAIEGRGDERLLRLPEVAAVVALDLTHVGAPDVGREGAAVDVAAEVQARHV